MATPEETLLTSEQQEKYDLITRNLGEVLGRESLKTILGGGRTPRGYWGGLV